MTCLSFSFFHHVSRSPSISDSFLATNAGIIPVNYSKPSKSRMDSEERAESPVSHISFIHEDEDYHPLAVPVRVHRAEQVQSMPPWLRDAVAERKRQLNESRELDEASKLAQDHFGVQQSRFDCQNEVVAEWLEGLPEKLVENWETMLREAGERSSLVKHSSTIYTDNADQVDGLNKREGKSQWATGPGSKVYNDPEDEVLEKVLLGRKRLMQAEISVKRLKMGLKHVTNGLCQEFGDEAAASRTRDLLAAVDTTFEEVVQSRLSTVTSSRHFTSGKASYRERLERLRISDPDFMGRIYLPREIVELKTMVADILRLDEQSGDSEGKQWFLRQLPRLLELREDMAEAEKEVLYCDDKDGKTISTL
jgi:hypothetical protein